VLDSGPVVRRPTTGVPKNKSKLRISFNASEAEVSEGRDSVTVDVGRPSRLGLSSAPQSRLLRPPEREDIEGQNHDRPTYNKAYLEELRHSTPSTPRDLSSYNSPSRELSEPSLDIESKFGRRALSSDRIPSAAEIREKKERRARLAMERRAAGEDDFIPLEDYDSDGEFKPRRMQVGTYLPKEDEKDSRLVPEDEDIAEGFDDFVEDSGRVTLSTKGLREQSRREREQMREMIDEAQGDSEEDESEAERNDAYEFAQTHHGMDGLAAHRAQTREARRPRQPKETTPVPTIAAGLARLREAIQRCEFERARIEKRRADIRREKAEIAASQEHIQKSLEESGKELEKLKEQTGNTNGTVERNGHTPPAERGLESFGDSPRDEEI